METQERAANGSFEELEGLVISVEELKQPARKGFVKGATRDGDDGSEKDHDR